MGVTKHYSGGLTREQFLFYEIRTISSLICEGIDRNSIYDKVAHENLFQYPTERMIRSMTNICFKRIDALDSQTLVSLLADASTSVAKQINLYAALENEPYDQRNNQSKGIITAMAKLAHDKALANNDGNTKSPETTAAAENTVLSADHSQKSASETSTYDKKGYLPAKILSVISAVLFALYGIQMFAMSKREWWNRFIVTDRALENDPSVYKPIMGMGGLMLSATALILFLYLQKQSNGSTNGKKLSVSSVITDLIGALAVNSVMFTYASSEFTVRLLPQSIIYTVIPLLCMILSIISIRTRKYKLGYVTSVAASVLKIRPLLHISFSGLSALAPTVFSLAIISFSAATFIICFFDSKQSYE